MAKESFRPYVNNGIKVFVQKVRPGGQTTIFPDDYPDNVEWFARNDAAQGRDAIWRMFQYRSHIRGAGADMRYVGAWVARNGKATFRKSVTMPAWSMRGGANKACPPCPPKGRSGRRATIHNSLFNDYAGAKRFLGDWQRRKKLPGNATYLRPMVDGRIAVSHHDVDVVIYSKNGSIEINPHDSLTTRQRIKNYTPYVVYRKDWEQFVSTPKGDFPVDDSYRLAGPYYDSTGTTYATNYKITKAGNVSKVRRY